jgi:dihydroneopterin aldolase/2-amino-4-hydroxy-6-hydroxymethyldihydropteridine diphosphokinase/dihydropteroate synthase
MGDCVGNIRRAVNSLDSEGVKVIRTGRMYESEPMYVEDQARFVNTVIEV